MPDKAAGLTLLQRVVMWILHAVMFYVVALYPIYLMARFEPDDVVHYGFLRWMAVALILYWAALHLFFTERPSESRVGRMFLAVTAAIVLIIGTFSPIVSFSFIGEIDYFRGGYGDGYILIIMAGLALALAVTGRWKQVLVPALGSLAAILWTFLGVQDTITQARSGDAAELTGNPYEGLAASVMQSIQWEWGWVLLFTGSGLLVYSAARRDQPEDEPPPLMSVAVEEEPEAVPAETASATEAEAAAAPAEEATAASAESVDAAEPAEPATEAPAEQSEAAPEAPSGQAEAAAAEPPPAESVGADEPKADEANAATDTGASAREPEEKPAEAAEAPAPEPEATAAETAAASTDEDRTAPATTEPTAAAEAAPAPASAPAEAATKESATAPAEAGKASTTD